MGASWIPVLLFSAIWGVVGLVLPFVVPRGPHKSVIQASLDSCIVGCLQVWCRSSWWSRGHAAGYSGFAATCPRWILSLDQSWKRNPSMPWRCSGMEETRCKLLWLLQILIFTPPLGGLLVLCHPSLSIVKTIGHFLRGQHGMVPQFDLQY